MERLLNALTQEVESAIMVITFRRESIICGDSISRGAESRRSTVTPTQTFYGVAEGKIWLRSDEHDFQLPRGTHLIGVQTATHGYTDYRT